MNWAARVANTILPLSKSSTNFAIALKEWYWTGGDNDIGAPTGTCGICGQPEIRYEFEIRNIQTEKVLWVGSECIKKFELPKLSQNGEFSSPDETAKELDSRRRVLAEKFKRQRAILSLISLEKACDELKVDSFMSYLGLHDNFTPEQLNLLFWNFSKYHVEYFPGDFKISLRKSREKEQILGMISVKLNRIFPALSSQQKKWFLLAKENEANGE